MKRKPALTNACITCGRITLKYYDIAGVCAAEYLRDRRRPRPDGITDGDEWSIWREDFRDGINHPPYVFPWCSHCDKSWQVVWDEMGILVMGSGGRKWTKGAVYHPGFSAHDIDDETRR